MTLPGFGEGGGYFAQLFSDLVGMLRSAGPVNWEVARQFATGIATSAEPEPNVDPAERMRIEELCRIAARHVADMTGVADAVERAERVRVIGRVAWAEETLEAWKGPLGELAATLSFQGTEPERHPAPRTPFEMPSTDDPDALARFMSQLVEVMGPTLVALQFGDMIGRLARVAFGVYDVPLPRVPGTGVVLVPANVARFATEWDLGIDDVRLWVCVHELAHDAVLARAHVADRIGALLSGYVNGFQIDPARVASRLENLDPGDPASLEALFGDPGMVLGEARTAEQDRIAAQLDAILVVVEGYVDHVLDAVAPRLIGSTGVVAEAFRRRRLGRAQAERFAESLFGLNLDQEAHDRGERFVAGVVERAGESGLLRLWESARSLPTPAELGAPGLWLERIDLPAPEGEEG